MERLVFLILERIKGEGAWMDLRYFLRSLSTIRTNDVGFNLVILDNLGLDRIFFFYRIKKF